MHQDGQTNATKNGLNQPAVVCRVTRPALLPPLQNRQDRI